MGQLVNWMISVDMGEIVLVLFYCVEEGNLKSFPLYQYNLNEYMDRVGAKSIEELISLLESMRKEWYA